MMNSSCTMYLFNMRLIFIVWITLFSLFECKAAEVTTITSELIATVQQTGESAPPRGKEADWIIGDHLMKNDHIVAVIGV